MCITCDGRVYTVTTEAELLRLIAALLDLQALQQPAA